MRALVLGAEGMLGTAVRAALAAAGDTPLAAARRHVDIGGYADVDGMIVSTRPDIVINCAGVIPLRNLPSETMVRVNALGPYVVYKVCAQHGVPMVQVSTDCVFSGDLPAPQRYAPHVWPDPVDVYGRSKALGEVPGAIVVRTSFIGPQHGLVPWLIAQPVDRPVPGYVNALWTGSTADEVAWGLTEICHGVITGTADPRKPIHLASDDVVSKYDVLCAIASAYGTGHQIVETETPVINRALQPSGPVTLGTMSAAVRRMAQR